MSDTLLGETLREMKISEAEIKEIQLAQESNGSNDDDSANKKPDVQPGNLAIVELFFTVERYWERVGMEAIQLYLDPLKVEARASKLSWYKTLDDQTMELLWHGLDIMEKACLATWAEHKKVNE